MIRDTQRERGHQGYTNRPVDETGGECVQRNRHSAVLAGPQCSSSNRSRIQGAAQPNIAQHNSEMGDRACVVVVFPLCGGRDTAGGKAGRRGQVLFPAGAAGNGMTLGGRRAALCGVLSGDACIPGQPIRARRFARGFPFPPPRRCVGSLRRCRGAAGAAPYVCLE